MTINEDQQHDFESEIEKENTISTENEPKGPPQACLFVASLSSETKEETLAECFGEFGTVLKIKFLKDRSARPYAFVQYLDVEDAETALEHTNGMVLDGRRLRVERAKVNRTLFLAKLPRDMSNTHLREIVEEFGPVESVTIIKNHQTNKSKGCGFVKFVYREDAIDAFIGLKNKNRKWVIEWATSTNDPDLLGVDKYNIFVGGLNPRKIDKELLEQRFGFYGEIESITLINRSANHPHSHHHDSSPPHHPDDSDGEPQRERDEQPDARESSADRSEDRASENDGLNRLDLEHPHLGHHDAESTKLSSSSGANSSEEAEELDAEFMNGAPQEQEPLAERSAFAFVRYKDPAHSASAIENENGTEWLDRRIRVQYCESQEMKNKRRASKFFQMNNGFNSPFYPQGMQLPPPMLMLGGHIPLPYNMAPPLASKFSPYGPQVKPDDPQSNMYNSFVSPYPMFAYNSAPWLYGMPQVPMENPLSPERQLSPDELMNGAGHPLGAEMGPLPPQAEYPGVNGGAVNGAGPLEEQMPVPHASLYHMPMGLGSDLSHMVHGGPAPPW